MLTAHLPSGYILARLWPSKQPGVLVAALFGAVAPDFDMLWFHFVDNGSIHHHRYWPHIPLIWAGIAAITLAAIWRTNWRSASIAFFTAIFLHLILDTIAGGIMWAYPANDRLYAWIEVPATFSHWILSFVLHWTFALEIAVWLLAAWLWRKGRTP